MDKFEERAMYKKIDETIKTHVSQAIYDLSMKLWEKDRQRRVWREVGKSVNKDGEILSQTIECFEVDPLIEDVDPRYPVKVGHHFVREGRLAVITEVKENSGGFSWKFVHKDTAS